MPRFGIPFLVVAIVVSCIAINTTQFPRVRRMLHPGFQGEADNSAADSKAEDSSTDFDSEIPEPIAALDLSGSSAVSSPSESSAPAVMVAESSTSPEARYADRYAGGYSDRYADGYSDRYASSPVVAEVAQPFASEHADPLESAEGESDLSPYEDNVPPMRSRGSWDKPSFPTDGEDETSKEEAFEDGAGAAEPADSGESRYGLGGAIPEDAGSFAENAVQTTRENEFLAREEADHNVFIPAPSAEPAARTEIEWPAEAAPCARYAQRSTTSTIAHAEVVEPDSTPESPESTAVASKGLVPVRRPRATADARTPAESGATPSLTVSEGRYADSEDTAALPQVERLPAVK